MELLYGDLQPSSHFQLTFRPNLVLPVGQSDAVMDRSEQKLVTHVRGSFVNMKVGLLEIMDLMCLCFCVCMRACLRSCVLCVRAVRACVRACVRA
jgi:hypothetical protein